MRHRILIAVAAVFWLAVPAAAQTHTLAWDASVSDGVIGYRVYLDGQLIGETTALAHPLTLSGSEHVLGVTAFNHLAESEPTALHVVLEPEPPPDTTAPDVAFTAVRRVGNSGNFDVTVEAADYGSGLARIDVYLGGVWRFGCTWSPCTGRINVSRGTHSVTAVAMDHAGNAAQASVLVTR